MGHKLLRLSILFLLGLGLTRLQAQEAIPTTGGDASGSGGSVAYSIGQIVYTTNIGTTGSVAQGVQQPFEISIITGINEARVINLMVTVYPNPTSDYLTLEVKDFGLANLNFQLYDIQGKLLQSQKITDNRTNIVMNNLTPATYFVKVNEVKKEIKTFKIIKN
jgi:hypothetical protein